MGDSKMKLYRFENVSIPTDWTGEQARAVVDFLEEICHAIWLIHERPIIEVYERQQDMLDSIIDDDDQMPF